MRNVAAKYLDGHCKLMISKREFEVVGLIARGYSTKQIANSLDISPFTVEKHITNMYARFDINSRVQLFNLAVRQSWIAILDG